MTSEAAAHDVSADNSQAPFWPASNPDYSAFLHTSLDDHEAQEETGEVTGSLPVHEPMVLDVGGDDHKQQGQSDHAHQPTHDGSQNDIQHSAPDTQDQQPAPSSHLDPISSEESSAYIAMISEAASSMVPSAVGSPTAQQPPLDIDQVQQAVSDAVASVDVEMQAAQQQDATTEQGHEEAIAADHGAEDASSPPAFDLSQFEEENLQAIAAAQIAAGLGDFDFGAGDDANEAEGDHYDEGAANTDQGEQSAQDGQVQNDGGAVSNDGPRGTKRPREDEGAVDASAEDHPASTTDLLEQFTTTATSEADEGNGNDASITQDSVDAMTAAATAAGSNEQSSTSGPSVPPPPTFQKAFSQFTFKPTTTEDAFQRYAPARNTGQGATAPATRPARPIPTPAPIPPTGPSSNKSVPAPAPAARPPTASAAPMPRPSMSFPRPPAPPVEHRAMPRPMPRPGVRPPPRPTTGPARPPAPALGASALFSGGATSGAPSFAALLSTLGPKDLAMVAQAAMGLDAEGNPLPGNEESHRALADAMKRLRESTMQPAPPSKAGSSAVPSPNSQQQSSQKSAGKSANKDGDNKPGSNGKSKAGKKAKSPSASSPNRSLPPDTVQRVLDALPQNTGDPLQDKQPLIAGPKPDRAPPKPGPPPEKRFPCPKCDRAFARAYNLNTHLSTHDPDPVRAKPFPCPYPSCRIEKRSFSRKHDLQRHIASTHESEPEPELEEVNDAEGGQTGTATLAKLGLGAPGRKFRCECGRAFVRRDALRRHNCEAMKAKWPEYANNDDSPASRRGGKAGEQRSVLEQASDADFDAIAASFAAAAEEEMRAAQEHAARAAARGESGEGGDENAEAEQPPAGADGAHQGEGDKPSEGSAEGSGESPHHDGNVDDDDDEMHSEEALAKLASQLTSDVAREMGIDIDGEEGEEQALAQDHHEQQQQQQQEEEPAQPESALAQQAIQGDQPPPQSEALSAAQPGEGGSDPRTSQIAGNATSNGSAAPQHAEQAAEITTFQPAAQEGSAESNEQQHQEQEHQSFEPIAAQGETSQQDEGAVEGGSEDAHGHDEETSGLEDMYTDEHLNDAASKFMASLESQMGQIGAAEEGEEEQGGNEDTEGSYPSTSVGDGGSALMSGLLASMSGGGGDGEGEVVGDGDVVPPGQGDDVQTTMKQDDASEQQPPAATTTTSPQVIPKTEETDEKDGDDEVNGFRALPDTTIAAS